MIYYLSGKMSGIEQHNFPAFVTAAAELRALGHTVVSPHELDHGDEFPGQLEHHVYMRNDLKALLECDAVALLPGWTHSFGSLTEVSVANACGMPVFVWDGTSLEPKR